MKKFPDKGQLYQSNEHQPSKTLVFFVHFYNGHKKALQRHIEFVNELGYDAYAFNLNDSIFDYHLLPWSKSHKKFGLKHVMADQIEKHFDLLTEYDSKIIYAFSNVSASAIEMMARKFEKNDKSLVGLLCDSGPGSDLTSASYNLLKHEFKLGLFQRSFSTPLFTLLWGAQHTKDLKHDFNLFPKNFPVLSLRGWRDVFISPKSIDRIFEGHSQLRLHRVDLPEAGHLNGLRDFPSEYKPPVQFFLSELNSMS